jgi:hypothetical protein
MRVLLVAGDDLRDGAVFHGHGRVVGELLASGPAEVGRCDA